MHQAPRHRCCSTHPLRPPHSMTRTPSRSPCAAGCHPAPAPPAGTTGPAPAPWTGSTSWQPLGKGVLGKRQLEHALIPHLVLLHAVRYDHPLRVQPPLVHIMVLRGMRSCISACMPHSCRQPHACRLLCRCMQQPPRGCTTSRCISPLTSIRSRLIHSHGSPGKVMSNCTGATESGQPQ